jgi:putative hemolysin
VEPLLLGELSVILVLIIANGFFSGAEMALITANRSRLKQMSDAGDKPSRIAMSLAETPNRFLATVQLGISLVGTLAAAFGGATLVESLSARLENSPSTMMASFRTEIAVVVVAVGIATVSIVLGELIPKRLALHNPVGLARIAARPIDMLARVARPVVWCMEGAATILLWPLEYGRRPPASFQSRKSAI